VYERLFDEFWTRAMVTTLTAQVPDVGTGEPPQDPGLMIEETLVAEAGISPSQEEQAYAARPYVIYSPQEVLRDRDFKDILEGEDTRVTRLIREIISPLTARSGVRKRPFTAGTFVDFRRLLRKNVLHRAELLEIPRARRKPRVRKLVFLCDVSGSMNPYLKFMLRFIKEIHAIPTRVESFVFATRLTRITPVLTNQTFARAMEEIGRTVRDWSGGTRIGVCLERFTKEHGASLLRPSTLVLIHSDGWDRGDPTLLEREMSKIQRRAYRVLWINPLLGGAAYEPTCRGMKTALPYVDAFLPGHSLGGLERVAGTIRGLL
ncbi:VWA domain-containing protein, partial [Thermodesulfobacteriota bacterium]